MDLGRRASFLLPLSLFGCNGAKSAEAVGSTFVDRYYIEKDHAKALEVSADLAARRVQEEQRLLAESGMSDRGAQPRVFYKLTRQTARGTDVELVYAMTIESGGMKIAKDVRLLLKPAGDSFKVVTFSESDLPAR